MNTTYVAGLIIVVLLTLGAGAWYVSQRQASSSGIQPIACPAIAKECPDGSYVGPTGPNCTFVCPSASSTPLGSGTLQGSMTIGPICPVEQVGNPCNPTPQMSAAHQVFVYDSTRARLITTLTPDAQGNFSASLPVGNYLVDVQHQGIGAVTGVPATITILSGKATILSINIDTGIR